MARSMTTAPLPQGIDEPQAMSTRNKAWIVFGAALGLTCGFGPFFFSVAGVFLKPLAASFHWGRADVALLPMLAMFGNAIGAPIIGYMADRRGWAKVIGWAIVLFSLGLLLLALVPPNHLLFGMVGVFIGICGAATSAAGYIAILPGAFNKRLGMALGIAMLGTGIGGFAMPMIAVALLHHVGWRQAYRLLAVGALVLGFVAHGIVFRNYKAVSARSEARAERLPEAERDDGIELTPRQALRTFRFWLLAFVFFLVSCSVLGGFVHLAPFVSDRGLGRDVAAQAAAVVGIGLAVARVGIGAVLDRVFAPLVASVACLAGAAVFLVLTTDFIRAPGMVMLSALVLGLATGSEGDLIPYLARRYFGKRHLGAIYGALFGISTLGGATGPFVYGMVFDHFKSYAPIHEVSSVVCLFCAGAILMLGRYPDRAASTTLASSAAQ